MMNMTNEQLQDCEDILFDELMADGEICRAFLRDPDATIRDASEWGVPLTESELRALGRRARRLWDRLADELEAGFAAAA